MKVFCTPCMCLQFGFVIFWWKDFGAKAANKMLVKLTPGLVRNRGKLRQCKAGTHERHFLLQRGLVDWVRLVSDKFNLCRNCYHLGNCDNFYFTIEFEYQMWVWIVWIFESDQIPNSKLTNKSNPNTDKPKDFWIRPNINEY